MIDTTVTEEELREIFSDVLDKGTSCAAILVCYRKDGEVRTEIGIPYSLSDVLEIGPYLKNIVTTPPHDYERRKKRIPISAIVVCKRIELSDFI